MSVRGAAWRIAAGYLRYGKNANASLVNISIIAIFCNSNHCHHHELFWNSLQSLLLNPLWVICPSHLLVCSDAFVTVTRSILVNFLAALFVCVLSSQFFIIFSFINGVWVFLDVCFSFVIWSCNTYIGQLIRNIISAVSAALMYMRQVPGCR